MLCNLIAVSCNTMQRLHKTHPLNLEGPIKVGHTASTNKLAVDRSHLIYLPCIQIHFQHNGNNFYWVFIGLIYSKNDLATVLFK